MGKRTGLPADAANWKRMPLGADITGKESCSGAGKVPRERKRENRKWGSGRLDVDRGDRR